MKQHARDAPAWLTEADYQRIIELVERYADMGIGTVDASIVAAAERLGITTVATLNRRDLAVVRPTHVDAFDLVPWLGSARAATLPVAVGA